jgi:hypothetical protein
MIKIEIEETKEELDFEELGNGTLHILKIKLYKDDKYLCNIDNRHNKDELRSICIIHNINLKDLETLLIDKIDKDYYGYFTENNKPAHLIVLDNPKIDEVRIDDEPVYQVWIDGVRQI